MAPEKKQHVTLGDISEIQTGPFGSQLHASDYKALGTPIITVEHLGDNKILHQNLPLVGAADRQRLSRYTLKEGDIVFTRVGAIDRRAYVSKREDGWLFSGRLLRVRATCDSAESRFLSHLFGQQVTIQWIRNHAVGSTMPCLNTSILSAVPLNLPPVSEQRRIAEILDTLDEAIRSTEQLIAKLKQMKQGLLHDLLTRGIDENSELRDHERHPEQFKNSPLGQIPRDWKLRNLSDIGSWVSGGTPSKANSAYWGGTVPWVSPKDMKKFLLESTQDTVTEKGAAAGSRIVPTNSIFIVVRGMILAHSFPVCVAMTRMSFNQDVKAIIPHEEIEGRYLAYWFVANSERMLGLVTEATHGTKRIDLKDLHRQCIAVPCPSEQRRILQVQESIDSRIAQEHAAVGKYRLLKQGLMEDLLTGRVPVTPLLAESTP